MIPPQAWGNSPCEGNFWEFLGSDNQKLKNAIFDFRNNSIIYSALLSFLL